MTNSELERVQPWPALIEGRDKKAVLGELARAFKAGELAGAHHLERLESGRWVAYVWRIKEPARRRYVPRSVLVAAGAVSVLSAAGGLGWWLVAATAPLAPVVGLPLIVGGAFLLLLAFLATRRASHSRCTTTVTITHRH